MDKLSTEFKLPLKTRLQAGWSGDFGHVNSWIRLLPGKETDCSESSAHKQINWIQSDAVKLYKPSLQIASLARPCFSFNLKDVCGLWVLYNFLSIWSQCEIFRGVYINRFISSWTKAFELCHFFSVLFNLFIKNWLRILMLIKIRQEGLWEGMTGRWERYRISIQENLNRSW